VDFAQRHPEHGLFATNALLDAERSLLAPMIVRGGDTSLVRTKITSSGGRQPLDANETRLAMTDVILASTGHGARIVGGSVQVDRVQIDTSSIALELHKDDEALEVRGVDLVIRGGIGLRGSASSVELSRVSISAGNVAVDLSTSLGAVTLKDLTIPSSRIGIDVGQTGQLTVDDFEIVATDIGLILPDQPADRIVLRRGSIDAPTGVSTDAASPYDVLIQTSFARGRSARR
jgi:hypothetical protein